MGLSFFWNLNLPISCVGSQTSSPDRKLSLCIVQSTEEQFITRDRSVLPCVYLPLPSSESSFSPSPLTIALRYLMTAVVSTGPLDSDCFLVGQLGHCYPIRGSSSTLHHFRPDDTDRPSSRPIDTEGRFPVLN